MPDTVIKVENLSKRYRIGTHQSGYLTLRETIVNAFQAPFKAFRSKLQAPGYRLSSVDDTIWALKDVSFKVRRGEVIGIIGRNGAGKSTLLKVLSKITEPTGGRVEMRGRVGSLLEVGTGFHPELTGHENIYLYGAILGMNRWEVTRKFEDIVAFAELDKFIETPVKRYSSGMYMRLAFAVSAFMETEILLVDEVLAVGDTEFQKKCLGKMGEVSNEGRTVIFVSHNMAAIENLCPNAILLKEGKIEKQGNTSSVIEHYLMIQCEKDGYASKELAISEDGELKIISIRVVDNISGKPGIAQIGKDLYLELALESHKSFSDFVCTIGINNIYGMRLSVLHSKISGYNLSINTGLSSIYCKIHNLFLLPGSYLLDLKIIAGKRVLIWSPSALSITINEGDFYKTGKLPSADWGGVCIFQQEWEVR